MLLGSRKGSARAPGLEFWFSKEDAAFIRHGNHGNVANSSRTIAYISRLKQTINTEIAYISKLK